jgi:hypothetical protein
MIRGFLQWCFKGPAMDKLIIDSIYVLDYLLKNGQYGKNIQLWINVINDEHPFGKQEGS